MRCPLAILLVAALLGALLVGTEPAGAQERASMVAEVNGETITLEALERTLGVLLAGGHSAEAFGAIIDEELAALRR
jgi:hypothetical protein